MKDVIIKKYKGGFRIVLKDDDGNFCLIDKNNNCIADGMDLDFLKLRSDSVIKKYNNHIKLSPLLIGKNIATRFYWDSKNKNYSEGWVIGKVISLSTPNNTGYCFVKFKMKNKIYYALTNQVYLDVTKETLDKLNILRDEFEQKEKKIARLFDKSFGESISYYLHKGAIK